MMRQLEHSLGLLADRGEPIPVDVLVGRLEAQLTADETAPDTVATSEQDMPDGPTVIDGLRARGHRSRWRGPLIAAGTAAAILVLVSVSLLFLGGGTGDVTIQPAPTTTMPAIQDDPTDVPAPIGAAWSHQGTVDDWLTEPLMLDGRYYATSKGIEDVEVDPAEGIIEEVGELWTSLDGVTWIPAEEVDRPPPTSPDTPTEGAAVVVRRNPTGDQYGVLVAEGLWATSDGTSWREIALRPSQDNWIPWVATGGLGWVVYSPPREATVEVDASSLFQGPRHGNLGLWYTPDTEAWFEVTDLGPLADTVGDTVDNDGEVIVIVNDGEVGVYGAAMVVRDTDILVYVNIATASGWGVSNPYTEIWRLELSPGEPVEAETPPTPTTAAIPTTATEAAPTTMTQQPGTWNPVLATTTAKVAPAAAGCPAGSNPKAPGPVDQNRPQLAGWTSNQSAVFDERAGRVIHVDDEGGTWAFDVCANTWTELKPAAELQGLAASSRLIEGELVYDVDSDATLYIRGAEVLVYDAADNTWTAQQTPPKSYTINYPGLGAVYDRVSGLVVVQTGDHGLVAYDVDTNTWSEIGTLEGDYPDFLVGYSAATDRLYFLGFQSDGVAVDPRSGRTEPLDQPGVMGGFGAFEFATSTDTAYVYGDGVCRLDPTSLDWTCAGTPDIPREIQNFESMVADPINNRLLLFHGSCCGLYPLMHDDVWALDFDTGEWSLVLEEANQRVHQ